MTKKQSIYTLDFMLLCLGSFFFFASFNMIIPELPNYLTKLGGEDYKGLIIALFTLTAGLSRPFSGKLADKVGRVPVMIFGALVCLVMSLIYPIITTVAGFLLLRFFHGFSTGFTPTGISAYVADIIPLSRRGEAMGIQSLFGSLGMASGPALGGYIASIWGLYPMFYTSSLIAFLAMGILWKLKETLEERTSFSWQHLHIKKDEILEPRVLAPSFILLLTVFSFGIVLTIIPDYSTFLGIQNKGLFFSVFTISSLAIRIIAGKTSDKYGRIQVLRVSTFCLSIAMILIGIASDKFSFLLAAVLFGVAVGMNSPTITAWTIDLSHDQRRGRALATMYIALEAGIGLGAIFAGWIYANQSENFKHTFWLGAIISFIAFLYMVLIAKNKKQTTKFNS